MNLVRRRLRFHQSFPLKRTAREKVSGALERQLSPKADVRDRLELSRLRPLSLCVGLT